MRLDEFLTSQDRRGFAAAPETDALIDDGALVGAALLDVRMSAVEGALWLLFDCRGALQVASGNTAVVVLHSLRLLQWEGSAVGPRTWRAVTGWTVRSPLRSQELEFTAGMEPTAMLRAVGSAGEFYVGDVPGCDDAPPNFLKASREEVRAGLQGWASTFAPVHASFLD